MRIVLIYSENCSHLMGRSPKSGAIAAVTCTWSTLTRRAIAVTVSASPSLPPNQEE